jgi:hypothetical protein
MFENRGVRRVFGHKRNEVAGGWRKLSNIVRMMKSRRMSLEGYVARMEEKRKNACNILVGKLEIKRTLERPRRRWEDNIKMYAKETRFEVVNWINICEDRDHWLTLCEHGKEPLGSTKRW